MMKIIDWIKYKYQKKKKKYILKIHLSNFEKIKKKVIEHPTELIQKQLNDTTQIPVIIINYNQLYYLKQLITFLKKVDTQKIVIIDNNSSYKPLLTFYDAIKNDLNIVIHRLEVNHGHMVFWKEREIFKKYSDGFFVITDADIVPNSKLGKGYLKPMLELLMKYKNRTKVGFALDLESIPSTYKLKDRVLAWENKFWQIEIEKDVFDAEIDTTFALYWPQTDVLLDNRTNFYFNALRMGGDYIAQHGGWYIEYENLTEEQQYYMRTANNSTSWKLDEKGNLVGEYTEMY